MTTVGAFFIIVGYGVKIIPNSWVTKSVGLTNVSPDPASLRNRNGV